jgi:quinol monooxygenase YgiN
MYGLIAKLTTVAGARDEMIAVLRASAINMPGCLNYIIAEDAGNESVLWVTEVWETEAKHAASLSLPSVKAAMVSAKSLVAQFERVAVTIPVGDLGAISAKAPAGLRSGG